MWTRIIIGFWAWIAGVASLMAQPSQFRLGALVNDGHLEIYDLHLLRHDPSKGQGEFLAVVGNHWLNSNQLEHIYFVHFAYGGTPSNMNMSGWTSWRGRQQKQMEVEANEATVPEVRLLERCCGDVHCR